MARFHFERDFDYRPSGAPNVRVAFKGGRSYTVKREAAEQALAAHAGRYVGPDARFNGAPAEAFDHDGAGAPGGSMPGGPRARRRRHRRGPA